jgi:hypothetical protein
MINLYSYIYNLEKKGELPFKVEKQESNYHDEYNSNEEHLYTFTIGDNEYQVGWWHTIEDAEDWAQAEAFNGDIFIKNNKNVRSSEIWEDIQNCLQIERDLKLNKLLNN